MSGRIKTYTRDEIVPFEEDLRHEFKGHRTISRENRIMIKPGMDGQSGSIGEYSSTRQHWSKYLCGMLNSPAGGTLYGGIQDDGRVAGFMMSQYQQDHVIIQLEDVFERYSPPVCKDQYSVRFVPVVEPGEEHIPDPVESDPELKAMDHFIQTCSRCWCDEEAAASHSFGVFLPFYIIEVEVKRKKERSVTYRAEDGYSYQTGHGSTANLGYYEKDNMMDSYRPTVRANLWNNTRCHNCGEMGHRAMECPEKTFQSDVRCYRCQEIGHKAMDCNMNTARQREGEASSQPYCYECDSPGHWVRTCPRILDMGERDEKLVRTCPRILDLGEMD